MADSGGHWKTLADAQKLTESTKIPGVFETDIKKNNLLDVFPVCQAAHSGKSIKWLREKNFTDDAATELEIGEQITWTDDVEYDEVETYLKRVAIARPLDKFNTGIHGTYNDYRAIALLETEKKLKRRIGDRLVYGDYTYLNTWDGIHALSAERGTPYAGTLGTGSELNIDQNDTGLSLTYVRVMINALLYGCDLIAVNKRIKARLEAAYQEKGFAGLAYNSAGSLASLTMTYDQLGKPIINWAGTRIVDSDYLMGETSGTGTGATSDARTKSTGSSQRFSMFFFKFGNIMNQEPGICFGYGGTEGQGDLYKLEIFPKLEDFDAEGIRLITYGATLMGSPFCLGRIADIGDAAILV